MDMNEYYSRISSSGQTIYDEIISGDDDLYIPNNILEQILSHQLVGKNLARLALRTRSKSVKEAICQAMGYPVPKSFKKTQPRFLSQNFDVYIQKSMNVQIWNEEVDPLRRYILIHVNACDIISEVKLITGDQLVHFDRTGTLTTKYQASMRDFGRSVLFSENDTTRVARWSNSNVQLRQVSPNNLPVEGGILPISELFSRLIQLQGKEIPHLDFLQERNRGAELHKLICHALGFSSYADDGSYPDILNQLIEIKLQTSPTIDLGLHAPADEKIILKTQGQGFRSKDIRYVVVDGELIGRSINIRYIHLVNGKDFKTAFPLFGGKVKNAKLQIPLPSDFFKE